MWNILGVLVLTLSAATCANLEHPQDGKGWLRVCQHDTDRNSLEGLKQYEVEAESCPHGAWLTEGISNSCICLNGLWAVSESWCDEDYYIVYGSGDCFQLGTQIKKLTYLGSKTNAFEPINLITKGNGHVFHSFSTEFVMPFESLSNYNKTLVRLRPQKQSGIHMNMQPDLTWAEDELAKDEHASIYKSFFPTSETLCVNADFKTKWRKDGLLIYKIKKAISSLKSVDTCPSPTGGPIEGGNIEMESGMSVHSLQSGQALHVKSGTIIQASKSCSSSCQNGARSRDKEKSRLLRHKRETPDMLQLDREFSIEDKDEIVRTSNLRVVKQELGWLLHANRPPVLKAPNWKLAQKAKEVFIKVCPEKEAPRFLVNAMMRLFRLFYMNSREFYPTRTRDDEKVQNERILSTLDTCLNDATEIKFAYNLTKDSTDRGEDENCREEKQANGTIKYCKCKELLGTLNVTYSLNSTGPHRSLNTYSVVDKDITLPDTLRFQLPSNTSTQSQVHDVPTETFWKIISFTHFYCAKYFKYNPADLSSFVGKLADFFNDDITYRWFKPGSTAFKTWQFMYNSFDLRKFAKSVDACLAISKKLSIYPEWLNRPTPESTRRKKRSVDSVKLWKGVAYCLNHPWDPVVKLGVNSRDEKCIEYNLY